MCLQKAISHT